MQPIGQGRAAPQDADNRNLRAPGQQACRLARYVADNDIEL
jgi:hypothetical protein